MNELERADLLKALRPAIRSYCQAEKILNRYWRDRRAIIWTIEQVHRAANERERVLTGAEARALLFELTRHHNAQYGVKWQDLLELIDQSVAGRKMTKRELNAFVEADVVTVTDRIGKRRV
jgi:hypothetical protein